MTEVITAGIATAVGLVFAFSTWRRWLAGRKRHELAWSISLTMFAIAAFSLGLGAQTGWTSVVFRLFYLFGAILNVPYLALGTIYLHFGERTGDRVGAAIVVFSLFAVVIITMAPLTHALPVHQLAQGSKVFGAWPRVLAGVGSGAGAITIFAGAAYSFLRAQTARFRISNLLIAAGTAIAGASGLLNSIFGAMTAFAIALAVAICVIYLGFLAATSLGVRSVAPVTDPPTA